MFVPREPELARDCDWSADSAMMFANCRSACALCLIVERATFWRDMAVCAASVGGSDVITILLMSLSYYSTLGGHYAQFCNILAAHV